MTMVEIVDGGHAPRPYPIPLRGLISGHAILYGYALQESTGAAGAQVNLIDGTDTSGLIAVPVALSAGQSVRDWFGPQGVHFRSSLLPQVTGSVIGTLFVHLVGEGGRWDR
jgi:hypothetical protein